jgi:Ni/Fe-hydrogenase 1 B-type cytochrome subunit
MSAAPKTISTEAATHREIYVWELPVRITHWLIVLSILLLSVTGYYLGHPFISVSGPPRDHFVMGTIRVIHLYTAIVFSLAVLFRIYWMFAGNRYARWNQFIPVSRERFRSMREALRFYGFIRRDPLTEVGHNGLAGATYAIIFLIELLMIATGLTLYTVYAPVNSVFQVFRFLIPIFGGLPIVHLIHHIGMWLLLIFVVHHVYSAIAYSITHRNGIFGSMFSGYKIREGGEVDVVEGE